MPTRITGAGSRRRQARLRCRSAPFRDPDAIARSTGTAVDTGPAPRRCGAREWLAAMVTARIVAYDPSRRTYRLPAEHAACLVRGAPLGNLAVYA